MVRRYFIALVPLVCLAVWLGGSLACYSPTLPLPPPELLAEPPPDPPLPEFPSPPPPPLPLPLESLFGPPDDKAPVVSGGHIQNWLPPC